MTEQSSIPSPNNKNNTPSTNKDLSCLRCRKKKAKCSKTRPTCTRCLRSNQSCEYPDAPPNLTDLSQKVLTLYDSLRELEGEFLVRYMQNQIESEPPSDTEDDETLLLEEEQKEEIAIKEPAGWSMSFGPSGLSLQAVTRNLNEYQQFIRSLSLQLARDFGQDCLPKQWDPDAEGYGEEAIEQDEVDEDEYLVTVQVDSIHTLFSLTDRNTSTQPEQDVTIDTIIPTFIQMHLPHMIEYLKFKYKQLKKKGQQPYHLVNIMLQLEPFLPTTATDSVDTPSMVSIVMGYITAIHLLPPSPPIHLLPPLPDAIWQGCIRHITLHLIDLVLSHEPVPYPSMLCILLLAWYETEMNKRNDVWIELALRIIYQQPEQERVILPALIYLDCYSAIFQSRKSIFSYDIKTDGWNGTNEEEEGILLETKLMKLLQKVLLLFYQIEREEEGYKKIDVDEVLDLLVDRAFILHSGCNNDDDDDDVDIVVMVEVDVEGVNKGISSSFPSGD
ncbi:hypothetical protein G6F46_001787 [Rhizopus delemar]|uniref:Zn(2)-C6 fungal-type domain-containing protein n=2 Tax=Rhizopus TaxID=4842 RepID=A0A9P6ZB44_9FUNG|nr:hypothetical protein G6F55_001352 [Rhizopus delemar]KAG1553396.1 hypothetical protein G6F51_000619 [Rhizopus arrhizus]KAG1504684.1 hypothetical protein G6F54_000828 [Rhizopus delemar]KAG1517380.1 hypothetical protein G6F53_001410 [Rhizopus delemar]KAG1525699.1 hypothetical protein G6F52_003090 [Rhizopus delemar]